MMWLLNSYAVNVILILPVLVLCLYLYLTRHFNYWKKNGIPYVEPLPLFGNLKPVFLQKLNFGAHFRQLYDDYKHLPYVGIFAVDKPALLVNDLDLIKNILVKDAQNFVDHIVDGDNRADPIFHEGIFSLKGEKWRHIRNKLTPTFTSGKMKMMFYLVNNCAKDLTRSIGTTSADGSPVPVRETLARFTTDAISTCALGIESNALKNPSSEVRHYMSKIFDFSIKKGFKGFLMFFEPQIYKFFKMKFLEDDTSKFFRDTVWETVKYRQQNGVVRNDLLDSLMELRKMELQEGETKVDGDIFVAQAFSIFVGGFETSSNATTFMLYELAKHPEIQNRLRKEICDVLKNHNNEVTYEAIQEMKYLDMVVSETLRKYPVLGIIDRVCTRDYDLPGPFGKGVFTLKEGTCVYIPLFGIHYNPEYYPDPDKFDPERFTEENKQKRHNYSYFPFGEGPRICIGKRFGLMQIKTALSHILPRFQVSPCKDTPELPIYDPKSFVLRTEEEIYLNFKEISV